MLDFKFERTMSKVLDYENQVFLQDQTIQIGCNKNIYNLLHFTACHIFASDPSFLLETD